MRDGWNFEAWVVCIFRDFMGLIISCQRPYFTIPGFAWERKIRKWFILKKIL